MQFEYYIHVVVGMKPSTAVIQDTLNTLGAQGWQLVAVADRYFYFMREVVPVRERVLPET